MKAIVVAVLHVTSLRTSLKLKENINLKGYNNERKNKSILYN